MNEENQLEQMDQPISENRSNQPQSSSKPNIGYGAQFGILIGLFGFGMIVSTIVAAFLWIAITHTDIFSLQKNMSNPVYANQLKIVQTVSTILMFFLPALVYAAIVNRKPLRHLGFISVFSKKQLLIITGIVVAGLFLSEGLGEINQIIPIPKKWELIFRNMENSYSDSVVAMATMKNFAEYISVLIVIALIPAVVEESFFRGALQQLFVKWFKNAWVGIIVTSIIFSAIHISYYGFIARASLGIILGLLFYYGKNIWLNILAHFLNNAIAVTQLYIATKNGKIPKEIMNSNVPIIPTGGSFLITLLSTAVALLIVIWLIKLFKTESIHISAAEIDTTISPSNNPFE